MANTYYNNPQACAQPIFAPVSHGCGTCSSSTSGAKKEPIYSLELLKGLLLANGKPVMDLACELINTPDFIAALNEWLKDQLDNPEAIKAIIDALEASPDFATLIAKLLADSYKSPEFKAAVNTVADLKAIADKACATLTEVAKPAKLFGFDDKCASGAVPVKSVPLVAGKATKPLTGAAAHTVSFGTLPAGRYSVSITGYAVVFGTMAANGYGSVYLENPQSGAFGMATTSYFAGPVSNGVAMTVSGIVNFSAPTELTAKMSEDLQGGNLKLNDGRMVATWAQLPTSVTEIAGSETVVPA